VGYRLAAANISVVRLIAPFASQELLAPIRQYWLLKIGKHGIVYFTSGGKLMKSLLGLLMASVSLLHLKPRFKSDVTTTRERALIT